MEHNISKFIKAINVLIVATLMLSFPFQGGGVIGAQAKARALSKTERSSSQAAQAVPTETPTPQGNPFGQLRNPTKGSLNRLAALVNASLANASGVTDTSYLKKLDSHLQDLVSAQLSGGDVLGTAKSNNLRISESQNVLMDIYVNGPLNQAVSQYEGLGMQVLATSNSLGSVVEGYMPLNSVLPAARLNSTKALLPVMGYSLATGSVTSQGDGAHNGPAARALGVNGAGVVVGIISDSMNQAGTGVAGSKGSGDLPTNVTVLNDMAGGTDEGRAMAEIIYDTAPGVTNMYFSTGANGPVTKAASINNLTAHGVRVIADDVAYLGEPFFQDGVVAQAVDNAYNSGVAYFPAAMNWARQSYESNFRNDGANFHDFDPSSGVDDLQTITTVLNGGCFGLALQWAEPWGAATHDFDIGLFNIADPSTPLATSVSDNIATGIPFEFIFWCNSTGSSVTVGDEIFKFAGTDTAFLKYIAFDNYGATFSISQFDTASEAMGPDAASANGAMTVAAVAWNQAGLNSPEPYSSRGPSVQRLFNKFGVYSPETRPKPNIAGADCVATSNNFPGGVGFGGGTFCGSSAAAPSVAGVAALILSANPSLPPSRLYKVLGNIANTIDCTLAGNPDGDCGFGFVLADKAVAWELPSTLSVPSGNIGTNYNPTYSWSQVAGATWYLLQVNANTPNHTVIYNWYTSAQTGCNGTTCSITPSTTLGGGAFTWWVLPYNAAGDAAWSAGKGFSTNNLGPATLTSPSGSIGTSYNPTYTWNQVTGATWYLLQVNTNSPNMAVIYHWYTSVDAGCNGSTCSVTPATTLGGGAFTWWVLPNNSGGDGVWSTGKAFSTTIPTKLGAATQVSPTGSIGPTHTPTYTWDQVNGSTYYLLQVNGSGGTVIYNWYTSAQVGCNGSTCSIAPSTSLAAGSYTWWVLTYNSVGDGTWSSGMGFTVSP